MLERLLERRVKRKVREVIERLYGEGISSLTVLKTLWEILSPLEKKHFADRLKRVEAEVKKHGDLLRALKEQGLIDGELYETVKSAQALGSVKEVLSEMRRAEELASQKKMDLYKALGTAMAYFFGLLVAIGVYAFKVAPLLAGTLTLPDTFAVNFVLWAGSVPHFALLALTPAIVGFTVYALRRRIPLIKEIYYSMQKFLFFTHLAVGLKAFGSVLVVLERYRGGLEKEAKAILKDLHRGVPLERAMEKNLGEYLSPFERARVVAVLKTQNAKEMAEGFGSIAKESLIDYDKAFSVFNSAIRFATLALTASVVILLVKFYMAQYQALSSLQR